VQRSHELRRVAIVQAGIEAVAPAEGGFPLPISVVVALVGEELVEHILAHPEDEHGGLCLTARVLGDARYPASVNGMQGNLLCGVINDSQLAT
jgi:hypothetical protein